MREIEFRGKRKDTGEWVYGYYIETDEGEHFIFTGETGLSQAAPGHVLMYKDFMRHEVIPETVGEYTGIKDKNDMKIFEGDIVSFVSEEFGLAKKFGDVRFVDCIWVINTGLFVCFVGRSKEFEIEDNIHDTPELLEE